MAYDIKIPTSKEEMETLRKSLSQEISEDNLDAVVGGNDVVKGKGDGGPWICPFCEATIMVYQLQDVLEHLTQCPRYPYK